MTVGGSLPVLGTIRSLQRSGDRITRIQCALSGSINTITSSLASVKDGHPVFLRNGGKGASADCVWLVTLLRAEGHRRLCCLFLSFPKMTRRGRPGSLTRHLLRFLALQVTGKTLSESVHDAMRQKFMENDPRVDLLGRDFARKLAVVALQFGHKITCQEINIVPFVPASIFLADKEEESTFEDAEVSIAEREAGNTALIEKLRAYDDAFAAQ